MRSVNEAENGVMPAGDTDFGGVLATLLAKKWWILLMTSLAFVGSVAFVSVATPKYTGEAKVILENRDNYYTRPDKETRGQDPALDAEAVQSQVQAIMSRDLAKTVIQKLKLNGLEEFDPVKKQPGLLSTVMAALGVGKSPLSSSPEERVLENYFNKLLVYNVGKSRVIAVEFSSKDPELAARGANVIADEFIITQQEAKKSTTAGASSWLAKNIEPLRARVAEAEARVEAYRAEHGLLIGASNATVATQQLGELSTQMSNARSTQSELQAKARIIREALRTGRVFETSEVVNNELVRRLLEQRVAMKTQIALEERTLLAGHPRMKELSAQLNDLEGQIRTAAERAARVLENDARVAGARVQSLQAELDGQKRTAANANGDEVQLRALEREARSLRDQYESYLAKYRDALARDTDAAAPADARVMSRAVVPVQPAFPKKLPIILLVTIATFVLTCAIILTRKLFSLPERAMAMPAAMPPAMAFQPGQADDPAFDEPVAPQPARASLKLRRPAPPAAADLPVEEEAAPAGPTLGSLMAVRQPQPASRPVARAAAAPDKVRISVAPVAPAARPARANEPLTPLAGDLFAMKPKGRGLIIGCHAFGGDVTSGATAVPLARLMARKGSAVLVDLTGTSVDIDATLGELTPVGITDILAGRGAFGEAIHRDLTSRLHVIPFGASGHDADLEIDAEAPVFRSVVDALVQTYDFVLLSAGALGEPLDSVLPMEDAILMIASEDDADPDVARAFGELDAIRPGCVTIVVEEPAIPPPRPANDRVSAAASAAREPA